MERHASSPSFADIYQDGVRHGVLRYLRCDHCGAAQTLTRYACSRCGSDQLSVLDAAGTGTVYAVTAVTRAPSDDYEALVPYSIVLVDLDEGVRVMAHGANDLGIGDPVVATSLPAPGKQLIQFKRTT
jgi:uncharacterized OB-fold protein